MRATLTDRDRRIATVAYINVGLAAIGAVYFPVLVFTLAPVLLGVAHIASDVRYLVLRRELARWWQNAIWLGCSALLGLRVLEELGFVRHVERVELAFAAAFATAALIAGVREQGSRARATAALLVLGFLTSVAWAHPFGARLAFLHLHNVIALLAWVALFRTGKRWFIGPLAVISIIAVALASGTLYRQTLASPFVASFHLNVLALADWVAPLESLPLAVGLTTAYLFLQSVHYSAWLSWIPQEAQPCRGTLTFRMSARSLFADLGAPAVIAIGVAIAAVLVGACFELQRTRALYLSLATFHGYMELALLMYFWVRATSARDQSRKRATALSG